VFWFNDYRVEKEDVYFHWISLINHGWHKPQPENQSTPGIFAPGNGRRIDRIQRQWWGFEGGQNGHYTVGFQCVFGDKHWDSGDAARAGGFDTGFGIGEFNAPTNGYLHESADGHP
jgi:hypothetical protein